MACLYAVAIDGVVTLGYDCYIFLDIQQIFLDFSAATLDPSRCNTSPSITGSSTST